MFVLLNLSDEFLRELDIMLQAKQATGDLNLGIDAVDRLAAAVALATSTNMMATGRPLLAKDGAVVTMAADHFAALEASIQNDSSWPE